VFIPGGRRICLVWRRASAKIAEPLDIRFKQLLAQYNRTGLPMFREILVLKHGKAKTKPGEEPRKADAAETEAYAREETAPEMRQGHGEAPHFHAVLEAVELAAEVEPSFQAVLKAIEAVKAAVELAVIETPEAGLKSGAEIGSRPSMGPVAAAVLCVRRAGRTQQKGQRQNPNYEKRERSQHESSSSRS
jgi:hypothetical protein